MGKLYSDTPAEPSLLHDVEENYLTGYIHLFRSIKKHWVWENPEHFKWWMDIVIEANHKPKKVRLDYLLIDCGRGQVVRSLVTWAKEWRVERGRVVRFLKLLENDGMIRLENMQKTTRITVCKYDSYNGDRSHNAHKTRTKRTADAQQTHTNNNVNNVNKDLYTDLQKEQFKKFEEWQSENAPSVSRLENPFTIVQFFKSLELMDKSQLADLILQMENHKNIKNKTSAWLTLQNWHRRNVERNGGKVVPLEDSAKKIFDETIEARKRNAQ